MGKDRRDKEAQLVYRVTRTNGAMLFAAGIAIIVFPPHGYVIGLLLVVFGGLAFIEAPRFRDRSLRASPAAPVDTTTWGLISLAVAIVGVGVGVVGSYAWGTFIAAASLVLYLRVLWDVHRGNK